MREIGVFPLELVLLPGERVPLHIFEPRYRELIDECVEHEGEFALLLAQEEGLREIGTAARVVELLERFPDGRMNVVVEGAVRIRVLAETSGRTFRTARIEDEPDTGEPADESEVERCLAAFRAAVAASGASLEVDPDPANPRLSYWLATRVDFGLAVKQELLELRSERMRLRRLAVLFARAERMLAWQRTVAERAATNGYARRPEPGD
jgi:ATP-dependent Lon protease